MWSGVEEELTHLLVELIRRVSAATSLREHHAAAVWCDHPEVGRIQPVHRGVWSTAAELVGVEREVEVVGMRGDNTDSG